MNNLKISIRNLFKKSENNIIKILSLGIGLSVGLLLFAKVTFELNYDDFYPDSDRIYQIFSNFNKDGQIEEYNKVSGGVTPGFKVEISEVEIATNTAYLSLDANYRTEDKSLYKADFILADENFFDILPRPVIIGNWKEILSGNLQAMVSESVAEMMGGDVIDKGISLEIYPGKEIIIKGIFKDLPKNSHLKYDIIVSMESIGNFFWDGRQNWGGNDMYQGYVKLYPGTHPASLTTSIRTMQEKYQPIEEILKTGGDLTYSLIPLSKAHRNSELTMSVIVIMSILAFALIITTLLNYILMVITSIMERNRQVAVYKCFGASRRDMVKISLADTVIHFVLALMVAIILLFACRSIAEGILGIPLLALLTLKSVGILSIILAIMFAVAIFTATSLQSGVSLAMLFKKYTVSKKRWKLALLFIQLMASALLFTLLIMMSKQYNKIVNGDQGYSFQNVLYTNLSGMKITEKQMVIDKFRAYSFVETVSHATALAINGNSGNFVSIPDDDRYLFNIADMYYTDEHFIPLFEMEIIDGANFSEASAPRDILVARKFKERMKSILGWEDIVGKEVLLTDHGLCKVVGVFEDINMLLDDRPAVLSYISKIPGRMDYADYIVIKLRHMNIENIEILANEMVILFPDREAVFTHYSDAFLLKSDRIRDIKNAVLIGGLITIIITIIGLIGYVNNETLRRKYEIAIRRVNGATLREIVLSFITKILYISLPATILGVAMTYVAFEVILNSFSHKMVPTLLLYCGCTISIIAITLLITGLRTWLTANINPVESLKSE